MKKVLVVDDNEDILYIVKHVLVIHGFDVQTCLSGLEVDKSIKDYNPDLILLDILLSGISGIDICKELKELYTIPVILFSALNKENKVFKKCIADGYLEKPFNADDLINIVRTHLN